ncbi:MAG: ABC transporter ATP-binding protein [Acidimicrobiia bacterium]
MDETNNRVIIEARDLAKKYGRTEALKGISFTLTEGEVLGYIGPNGAGKTTTIRLILGLLNASSGQISVFGENPRKAPLSILSEVGYIPGEFGLWPSMTGDQCLDYLASLHTKPPKRQEELCERFEFSFKDLDRSTRFYSRGMRQKVAVIQAFQHVPRLVIMDEPTEGLDPVMKDRFVELVREHRAEGGTVLYSSHILSEVEDCADRVAVLRKGEIVKSAAIESLAADKVRHCVVVLKSAVADRSVFEISGLSDLRGDDRTIRFDFRGDMAPLFRVLGTLQVEDFVAERESLTEAFFEVYGDEAS